MQRLEWALFASSLVGPQRDTNRVLVYVFGQRKKIDMVDLKDLQGLAEEVYDHASGIPLNTLISVDNQ